MKLKTGCNNVISNIKVRKQQRASKTQSWRTYAQTQGEFILLVITTNQTFHVVALLSDFLPLTYKIHYRCQ